MEYSAEAKNLVKHAKKIGLDKNYLFLTAYDRYLTLVNILEQLEKSISENGETVTKEYVKGRENICINPAITEYNKTVSSANATMKSIINLFNTYPKELNEKEDSLTRFKRMYEEDD